MARLEPNTSALALNAVSAASAAPTVTADADATTVTDWIRLLVAYGGTVSAANLRVWGWDRSALAWYRLGETDDVDPLTGSTNGAEARDVFIGRAVDVHVQLASITGGGNVTVRIAGVDRSNA